MKCTCNKNCMAVRTGEVAGTDWTELPFKRIDKKTIVLNELVLTRVH